MQLKLSSLTCRIIVLQKYTVCFQEEARLEDCEFYLTAQRFIVLPMQRQRMESSDGNQEPSVVKKIKELWLKNLAVRNAPSSDPSISQLIDAIGQNQLEILKENAEECLDLQMSKEKAVTVTDEIPVTEWEAERRKEQGEDVFMVPVNTLVIPPEEEEVACDSSKADTNKTTPGKSSDDRTVPGDPSVVSKASHDFFLADAESLALSDSLEGSMDNPWNRIPPLSLTPSSSDENTFQPDTSLKTQKDVAADSNTPDLLELCSQDSPESLPQGEPVQTTSPSLLCLYSNSSPVETGTSQAASASGAACNAPCTAQDLQGSRSSQAALPALSPAFPVLPSSSLQPMPDRVPH
ncbi:ACD protein, partial [Scytalopus superciliaris]|nr:ACD protein [Scytalopus superciliaris]